MMKSQYVLEYNTHWLLEGSNFSSEFEIFKSYLLFK